MRPSYGDKIWETLYSTESWGRYPSEETIRFFMRYGKRHKPKVLDIGCGQGAVSWFMAREGAEVDALDGSQTALENLPEVAASFGITTGINSIYGDITQPHKHLTELYDVMIDHYALCCNAEQAVLDAYRQYFKLLKPGGHMLTCCFGPKTAGVTTGEQMSEHTYKDIQSGTLLNRGLNTIWEKKQFSQQLENIGFLVKDCESIIRMSDNFKEEKVILTLQKP